MRLVVGGRASGKSTGAVHWLAKDPANRVIITPDFIQKRTLAVMAEREFPGHNVKWLDRIFHVSEIQKLRGRRDIKEILVEELDSVLYVLLGVDVSVATLTGEVEFLGKPQ